MLITMFVSPRHVLVQPGGDEGDGGRHGPRARVGHVEDTQGKMQIEKIIPMMQSWVKNTGILRGLMILRRLLYNRLLRLYMLNSVTLKALRVDL